jgi:hypothetical protein
MISAQTLLPLLEKGKPISTLPDHALDHFPIMRCTESLQEVHKTLQTKDRSDSVWVDRAIIAPGYGFDLVNEE